ncbi:hypothetical protein BH10CYA1_BH10CYA1_12560 [soil metagenome]
MKGSNCRGLLGKLLLCAGLLFAFAPATQAQSLDSVGGTSFGNFGAGGAYGDFDMQAQAQTWDPAGAGNVNNSSGAQGNFGRSSYKTNEAPAQQTYGDSQWTGKQIASNSGMGTLNLPVTQTVPLDKVFGGGRKLPPTRLDSFVRNAGGSADQIYGDEGGEGIPPFFGFDEGHYIGTGINSGQLTTGHRSGLPSAWGYPQ